MVAAAPTATFTATVDAADVTAAKDKPGDTYSVDFEVTFATWATTDLINPPYNLQFTLTPPAHPETGSSWGSWNWGTTCTNKQFGATSADTTVTPNPTMNTVAPTCSFDSNGVLTIAITDEKDILTSTDWTTFKMIFTMSVTNPSDFIKDPCTVGFAIVDPYASTQLALASTITAF